MKKLLYLVLVVSFASCVNGTSPSSNPDSVAVDTPVPGPVITTDSSGAGMMNADTTGMGQAR